MSTTTATLSAKKDPQQHHRNLQEAGHYVVTSHRASSVTNALRCSFLGPDTTVRPVCMQQNGSNWNQGWSFQMCSIDSYSTD
jgi:hypothetical protein